MIAKLTGRLDDTGADWAILDVNGVGYFVHCSARTLSALGPRGDVATLHTDLQVSENDLRLIGFAKSDERAWFRLLTQVQGVGSKVALAILSALDTGELHRAVATGDGATVARANGVGPKLASRIVNELKDKAGSLGSAPGVMLATGGVAFSPPGDHSADAVAALTGLGFRPAEAARAVGEAAADLGEEASLDALVRGALKRAGKQ